MKQARGPRGPQPRRAGRAGLADTLQKSKDCVPAWGNPVRTEKTPCEYARVTWEHNHYVLELEVWAENGEAKVFGKYQKGTVKRIAVSKSSN